MGLYQDNLQHQLERLVKCDVSVSGSVAGWNKTLNGMTSNKFQFNS